MGVKNPNMTVSNLVLPGSKVLVTGATGFIGAHCVKELLEKGYQVRAAVRSEKKFQTLESCVNGGGDLGYTLVRDIDDLDLLTEAVKGCDAVLHLASPFTYDVTNYEEELLKPALRGTTTILEACLTEPKVKRVVITSSFAAIFDSSKGLQPDVTYTEKDFSPLTWEDGATASDAALAYRASKIVAEQAAWNFVKEKNPHFDITIICPTMVFGPLVSTKLLGSIDSLNLSNTIVWNVATSDTIPPTKGPVWVDVRDLAYAHVKALSVQAASNSRYVLSASDYDTQEIADILRELPFKKDLSVPVGSPGERLTGTHFKVDNLKSVAELELTYRPLKESILDLCHQLLEYVK